MKCHICNENGHKSYQCKKVKCYKCNKLGHIRRNCPESGSDREVSQRTQEESGASEEPRDSDSDYDICFKVNEGSVAEKNYWIYDSAATCHMGPSLDGCTNIVYVNDRVTVGNGSRAVCKARATFKGTVVTKEGKTRNITIDNFAYVPELTDYLFSGTFALQKGFHVRDEDNTVVLFKDKVTIKFDRIVKKGSSFIMCLKVLPKKSEKANISGEKKVEEVKSGTTTEAIKKSKEANELLTSKKASYSEYHGKLGHPSHELTTATAKKKGIRLGRQKVKFLACMLSKAKRKSIKKVTFERETVPGRTLHIDISLVKRKSKGGAKFWLQIADGATSKKWSFFLKKKSDQ